MSSIIHLLPDSVVNQIAAGEVIQRPASVVKELVENAVDAGATDITVAVVDGGRTLIHVIDNGCGMSENDARMAFERHATSKITDSADLYALSSMGFRGEALASIAAVAQVELLTRKKDEELGVKLCISASQVTDQTLVQTAVGSQFLVKNLFFNVPARRRFLKSDSTEMRCIITEFLRVALAHPNVAMTLVENGNVVYKYPSGNLKQRVIAHAGFEREQELLPIETETSVVRIKGYIGSPKLARKSCKDQFFFVNDRFMKHPYFHRAVMAVYENLIKAETLPPYYIYMEVDPARIDVNVHPQKTEIKFEDESVIWQTLNAVVRECFGKFHVAPSIDFDMADSISIPTMPQNGFGHVAQPEIVVDETYNPFLEELRSEQQGDRPAAHTAAPKSFSYESKLNSSNWETLYNDFSNARNDVPMPEPAAGIAPLPPSEPEHPQIFESGMNGTGSATFGAHFFQFKGRYIITSVKSGLMLIDQHRAHERIQYESILSAIKVGPLASQQLIFPENVAISPDDACIIDEISAELAQIGFDLKIDDRRSTLIVTAIPSTTLASDVQSFVDTVLSDYKNGTLNLHAGVIEYVARTLAAKSAIAYGKELSQMEMSDLFDRLFACEMPGFSPSGKPVTSIISMSEIEANF